MTPGELLAELQSRGVSIRRVGDRLRLRPRSRLTPDLLERVSEHKPALLAVLSTGPDLEVDRACRLDREQYERDRIAGRGYDNDTSAPSHPAFCREHGLPPPAPDPNGPVPNAWWRRGLVGDLQAAPEAPACVSAAMSLIQTCVACGVPLRLEPSGDLVIGPGAWRSLVRAVGVHVDQIAILLAAGHPYDA